MDRDSELPSLPVHERTPTPIVGVPIQMPAREEPSSINVMRLHVPLTVVVSVVVTLVATIASMTLVYAKVVNHADDQGLHLDTVESTHGGGPAFKLDVAKLAADTDRRLVLEHARMRRLLRAMEITCTQTEGRGLACRVALPESE